MQLYGSYTATGGILGFNITNNWRGGQRNMGHTLWVQEELKKLALENYVQQRMKRDQAGFKLILKNPETGNYCRPIALWSDPTRESEYLAVPRVHALQKAL